MSMFSARRSSGRPGRGDGAHYTPIKPADVFARFCLRTWKGKRQTARIGRCDVSVDIREEALTLIALEGHAAIPIAFVVERILAVTLVDGGLGGMTLTETAVDHPYVKDYDVTDGPASWP